MADNTVSLEELQKGSIESEKKLNDVMQKHQSNKEQLYQSQEELVKQYEETLVKMRRFHTVYIRYLEEQLKPLLPKQNGTTTLNGNKTTDPPASNVNKSTIIEEAT